MGFPDSSVGKESTYNAGDPGLIPGLEGTLEKQKATHAELDMIERFFTFSSVKLGIWLMKGKKSVFGIRGPRIESQLCHSQGKLSEEI